jgi:hypothetical protein
MKGPAVNVAAVQAQLRSALAIIADPDDHTRSALLGACDVVLTHGNWKEQQQARELQKFVLRIDETLAHLSRRVVEDSAVPFEWVDGTAERGNGAAKGMLIVIVALLGILVAALAYVAVGEASAPPAAAPTIEPASEPFIFIRKKDHRYV